MAVASNPDTPKQEEEEQFKKNNGTYKITELIRIASVCDNCVLVYWLVYITSQF